MQEEKKQLRTIPLVAIRGSVVFPNTDAVLSFGRKKSVSAVNSAFREDKIVGIVTQKEARVSEPLLEDLYKTGTIATITQMMSTEGEIHAVVRGRARIKIHEIVSSEPYLTAKIEEISEKEEASNELQALTNKTQELFKKAVNLGKQAEIMAVMKLVSNKLPANELTDQVASLIDISVKKKQALLEMFDIKLRLKKVFEHLTHEVNILELEKTISSKTQKRFEDQMKKAMLREKKRTIEKELGEMGEMREDDMGSDEVKEYRAKIKKSHMPKKVREKANKELKRLTQMSPHNPEGGYIRNYLDWLTDMPWGVYSPNNIALTKAAKILENDHFGMKKAKERILEYLAVMQIKKEADKNKSAEKKKKLSKKKSAKAKKNKSEAKYSESQPTILCFIGPPGVGKTSIGKSIARALGRKFVRMSLGGIRDEAEIRGHRRTYVGALPGRIIQGIKNAETNNPVFMLDEIDKIGSDFRGDPSSALLEALDPEQNREFSDHYLEVAYDLSEVMFICTGNVIEEIPVALRDRMEIIPFPGYTQDEKFNIAKDFLWPKQLRLHGLNGRKLKIEKNALEEVISRYTREAGVRNLERNLANTLRKVARQVAEKKKVKKSITKADVRKYLGPQKFSSLLAEKDDEVGMSTGLAVTAAGGEILFIEVSLMPGKGRLTLTGQLGDVMKESAKAAFTWAKSHWAYLGLNENFGRNIDAHIHVPEGAVPKDGPSAGIAISTALISALSGQPVKRYVGMTGEVTLRGRVLEIGGVKEKVIAAHRAGIKTVVLPKDNKKDMEDVPKKIQKDIKFIFAERLEDVLKVALGKWPLVKMQKNLKSPLRPAYLTVN